MANTTSTAWPFLALEGGNDSSNEVVSDAISTACERRWADRFHANALAWMLRGLNDSVGTDLYGLTCGRRSYLLQLNSESTQSAEEEVRRCIRYFYTGLSSLSQDEMESHNRFQALDEVFGGIPSMEPSEQLEALGRVLSASSKSFTSAARAATLRYLSQIDQIFEADGLTRLLVARLNDGSEAESIAAARTIGDIADVGVIPLLTDARLSTRSERLKQEIERAVRRIEGSYESSEAS